MLKWKEYFKFLQNLYSSKTPLTTFVHQDFDFVAFISFLNIHFDCIFNSVSEKHNIRESQAALLRCSQEKVFRKYAGNLQENNHVEASVILMKLLSNFIEVTLWHGFSPVNLLHIFRTPCYKYTSGRLLLEFRVFFVKKFALNLENYKLLIYINLLIWFCIMKNCCQCHNNVA